MPGTTEPPKPHASSPEYQLTKRRACLPPGGFARTMYRSYFAKPLLTIDRSLKAATWDRQDFSKTRPLLVLLFVVAIPCDCPPPSYRRSSSNISHMSQAQLGHGIQDLEDSAISRTSLQHQVHVFLISIVLVFQCIITVPSVLQNFVLLPLGVKALNLKIHQLDRVLARPGNPFLITAVVPIKRVQVYYAWWNENVHKSRERVEYPSNPGS